MFSLFKRYWFLIITLAILLLAIFLRFANYPERWGIAYDQAHDALIAHYAVTTHKLPLLGPFSSAGPFQTGGEWYWFIMLGTAIAPSFLLSPWILMTLLYVVFVFIMIIVAKEIGGKSFALLAGLFAAVSPAQIAQGTNLTNQSPQAIMALLSIWCAVLYLKKPKLHYLFLIGLCVGIASSIHLSGGGIGALILALFIVLRRIHYKMVGAFILGGVLPWVPVLLADIQNHFINTQNMVKYYLYDQHKITLESLGRRWLTYLGVFLPAQWAYIIGGFPFLGYVMIGSLVTFFMVRKRLIKEVILLLLSIFFMVILLRYTHTPIFESYLVFTHPFILLLTAWVGYVLLTKRIVMGVIFLCIIVSLSLYRDYHLITTANNTSAALAKEQIESLERRYPDKKFAVYTDNDKWKDKNYILALYLTKMDKLDPNGIRISTIIATTSAEYQRPVISGEPKAYQLIDITSSSSALLHKHGWKRIDGESVYKETEEWYK